MKDKTKAYPDLKHSFIILILVSTAIIYSISLIKAPYFFWDDDWMVLDNPYLKHMDLQNLKEVFMFSYSGQYSPVNTTLYILLVKVFGFNSFIMHLAVIGIHLINTYVVYVLIWKILSIQENIRFSQIDIIKISGFIAFLFGVGSVQIESVAWISASKIVLYGLFMMLSIIFFLNYIKSNHSAQLAVSLVLFVFALLSKEQAVVLPLILLSILYYFDIINRKKLWLALIPYFILAIGFGLFVLMIQSEAIDQNGGDDYYPFYQRFVLATYSITQYLVKTILPIRQWIFYSFPMQIGESVPFIFHVYPLVVSFLIFYLLYFFSQDRKKYGYIFFGTSFFLINIFLTLHIIPMNRHSLMADRYLYLPMIGIYYVLFIAFFNFFNDRDYNKNMIKPIWLIYFYCAFIFVRSLFYIVEWSNYWANLVGGY